MTARLTLDQRYFDAMYQSARDPWGFESRWYERRKRAISVALLPQRRYQHAFEPGCSTGMITSMLASRCDRLLSCDVADAAVRAAAEQTRGFPHVRVERRRIPGWWPRATFDLIVVSEILYYFGDDDLARVTRQIMDTLRPGGTLLAVHWRHPVAEHPQTGDHVHALLQARSGLGLLASYTEPDFLAQAFIRTSAPPVSVAQATGLA